MIKKIQIPRNEIELIHNLLHSGNNMIFLRDEEYRVFRSSNGCRYVDFQGVRFMEQNKQKHSIYAEMAKKGKKITWGMSKTTGKYVYRIMTEVSRIEIGDLQLP